MIPRSLSPNSQRKTMNPSDALGIANIELKVTSKGERSMTDLSSDRLPMLSPREGHKDYNRYKYYSALRTGYSHLGIEEPYLEPPSHVIDKELFLA